MKYMWKTSRTKQDHFFDSITIANAPDKRITWTPEMYQAFDEVKRALLLNAPLNIVDPAKPFIITVDESWWAVGCV